MKTRKKKKLMETRVSKAEQLPLLEEEAVQRSAVAAFLDSGPKRKRKKSEKPIMALVEEAKVKARSGDWSDSRGKVFVGLYAICHEMVYGEISIELDRVSSVTAGARAANTALHNYFDDSPDQLVEFVKWSWEQEKRKNSWALRNGIERKPLSINFQFSPKLIQEYRISKRRNRG